MTKPELRRLIRNRKAECPVEERQRLSALLCQQILRHPRWQEARTILLYHALPDEVDTSLLLHSDFSNLQDYKNPPHYGGGGIPLGCRRGSILLPVVTGNDLELREYTGEMKEGAFHIKEPVGPVFTAYDQIDLAVIPGMAFDSAGHRLGRGKGYYDRLLPRLTHAYRLGLCFPFQLLDEVPAEPHDIAMHKVVSMISDETKYEDCLEITNK